MRLWLGGSRHRSRYWACTHDAVYEWYVGTYLRKKQAAEAKAQAEAEEAAALAEESKAVGSAAEAVKDMTVTEASAEQPAEQAAAPPATAVEEEDDFALFD